jgi:anaerobic selenocysteine-containing dehydrogenase
MQALTSLFARQFGTPNYAAHGGFCSVNMAAGMIYTIGGSFWEFGGPDLERAKLFVMIGTAEDHHSNPLKIAIGKFKRPRRPLHLDQPGSHRLLGDRRRVDPDPPGTDGALFMALLHELIASDLVDHAFLKRYTNAPQLVVLDDGEREGLFAHDPDPAKGRRRRPPSAQQADLRPRVAIDQGGVSRKASPTARIRRSRASTRSPTARGSRRRSSSCATASAVHAGVGGGDHRDRRRSHQEASPASSARPRCGRRSSCRSPGPTPGACVTRRRRRGRSRSTRCAAWRRTRTASRRCARSPC